MGIDKETTFSSMWFQLDNTPQHIKALKKNFEDNVDSEEGKPPQLLITNDTHTFMPEEVYYDEADNAINISGSIKGAAGEGYIGVNMPLSDILLIDILQMAIKKLNKLKTAMESLK